MRPARGKECTTQGANPQDTESVDLVVSDLDSEVETCTKIGQIGWTTRGIAWRG